MKLQSATIPSTVKKLCVRAFRCCYNLVEVRLNEGLPVIGDYAFEDCVELRRVTLPSSAIELVGNAFNGCSNISEVIVLDGKRLLNQEFVDCGFLREEKGLLNREEVAELFLDEDGEFVFRGPAVIGEMILDGYDDRREFPLILVKISISWAISERMTRLPRKCRLSVEDRIHNLRLLEVQQDGNVLACFPVVRMTPGDEADDDSEDWAEAAFKVQDTNNETARSLYQVLQLIAFHELKESSILIELAIWKSRIDGATSVTRADCRVSVPDPAKSLIMEYYGFAGFLEPVIEGA